MRATKKQQVSKPATTLHAFFANSSTNKPPAAKLSSPSSRPIKNDGSRNGRVPYQKGNSLPQNVEVIVIESDDDDESSPHSAAQNGKRKAEDASSDVDIVELPSPSKLNKKIKQEDEVSAESLEGVSNAQTEQPKPECTLTCDLPARSVIPNTIGSESKLCDAENEDDIYAMNEAIEFGDEWGVGDDEMDIENKEPDVDEIEDIIDDDLEASSSSKRKENGENKAQDAFISVIIIPITCLQASTN
jgi:hypothetical protein